MTEGMSNVLRALVVERDLLDQAIAVRQWASQPKFRNGEVDLPAARPERRTKKIRELSATVDAGPSLRG
jgi:hypothetical protein